MPHKEMTLAELRASLGLTQVDLAKRMKIGQNAVSRLELRDNIRVGTLNRLLRAMGAELEVRARLPDGTVRIIDFRLPLEPEIFEEDTRPLDPEIAEDYSNLPLIVDEPVKRRRRKKKGDKKDGLSKSSLQSKGNL